MVGDTNQLPPSTFFKTLIDDEEADEDETVLNESILEMANATFRPARRLRWHYRSRNSGLIKFSNRLVYDDDLIVFIYEAHTKTPTAKVFTNPAHLLRSSVLRLEISVLHAFVESK